MAVIGRAAEVDAIRAALDAARGGPAGVVLEGEPGIGKTALWEEGLALAADGFPRALVHRSVATEAPYAFSGLQDIVGPVLDEAAPALVAPRRRALEVALLLSEPSDGGPAEALAIGLAVHDVLAALAPVLIALDDVQWLDASTGAVLQIALRRLETEPVAVLATMRASGTPIALADALPRGALTHVRVGALSEPSMHDLLLERLDLSLSGPELARIHEASGGNPFFALELARSGLRAQAGRPLPVPETLRDLLGRRLDELPTDTLGVLLDTAALARPTIEQLTASRSSPERVRAALGRAREEGILVIDGRDVRFAHPLLGALAYERAAPWEREEAHRRLAQAAGDPEERARHLALADDRADEAVARQLEHAAAHAGARGAVASAAELAELSVLRTPDDSPPDRLRRLRAAAGYHHRAGALERAAEMFEELRAELPAGPQRTEAVLSLAVFGRHDMPARIAMCKGALVEAGDGEAAALLSFIAMAHWAQGEIDAGLCRAREALQRAELSGDRRRIAAAIARVGMMETFAVDVTPDLLERGVAIEEGLEESLPWLESPRNYMAQRLVHCDGLDEAERLCRQIEEEAFERGDEHSRHMAVLHSILTAWQAGRLSQAVERGNRCRRFAQASRDPLFAVMTSRLSMAAKADLGELDAAQAETTESLRLAESMGARLVAGSLRAILGRIDLLRGDMGAAAERLAALPAQELQMGYRQPGAGPWFDAIEALIAVGRLDRARTYTEQVSRIAVKTSRWARAGAARSRGLLAAAEGDTAVAEAQFADALGQDESCTYPLERGRTLLALGTTRRRARHHRAAREALQEAIAIFDEIGAAPWAAKARAELGRVSGRRAPDGDLTPAERRVATLAAAGRQNKEIATELFVGVGTVEAHLSRIYRKLDVRSRTELAARLGDATRA